MKKPRYLWHGSSKEIKGDKLISREARDLGEHPENLLRAVYATDKRDLAIAMAIIKSEGVKCSSLNFNGNPPYGIIYEGIPQQEHAYLFKLPSKTFQETGHKGRQWVSLEAVEPLGIEEIVVKDHMNLVRDATEKEKEEFFRRFGEKIKQKNSK
jgi:hypothetical protein